MAHVYGGEDRFLRVTFRAEQDEVMALENLDDPYFGRMGDVVDCCSTTAPTGRS